MDSLLEVPYICQAQNLLSDMLYKWDEIHI